MFEIAIFILKILLFLSVFIGILTFLLSSKERQIVEKLSEGLNELNKKYEKRLLKMQYKKYYTDKKETYIDKLDILIEKSNIRRKLRISSEMLIIISLLLSIVVFILSMRILFNIFAATSLSIATFFIPKLILSIIANINASKVDNELMNYINVLENFCTIKDDIIYAIENSIPYMQEPLRTFSISFLSEVNHGITPTTALENYKSKVDNRKFKILIKDLQLCANYTGSYVNVLHKSKEVAKNYTIEKNRRKEEAHKNRGYIYIMMLISFIIFCGLLKINPDLVIFLKTNIKGQLIVTYNICIYLYAIYKSITIQKFEF